ncbi:MAG: MFS family permease [Planctomycetota bacterium]|jgi:MFS family permease
MANGAANLRGYLLVTICYWAFTISDGALRMLVLLHLHEQGQTAWALALLLVPYEVAGVVTNLLSGFLGARFGLKAPLVLGIALQAGACAMLTVDAAELTLVYVMGTQVMSGIAKDLTKVSAKSYVRELAPSDSGARLFRLVAWMTGSKNTMKGFGFFVGGALLTWCGFAQTNLGLAIGLGIIAVFAFAMVPRIEGRRQSSLRTLFQQDRVMVWLSTARAFLFGSRDAWFAVALPLYLVANGWPPLSVGAALAVWVILYGVVQGFAPSITKRDSHAGGIRSVRNFTSLLFVPLLTTAILVARDVQAMPALLVGLCVYGALFAITSSLHSWLAVSLHNDGRTAERVGFYYAANALGRLLGTLLSGYLYAVSATPGEGLANCLYASVVAVVLAAVATATLQRAARVDAAR